METEPLGRTAGRVDLLREQHLETYARFFGEQPSATPAQADRYVVTTITCLALLVVGTVGAIVARWPAIAWTGATLLVVAAVVATLFAVPRDRWEREPEPRRPASLGPRLLQRQ